MRATSVDKVSDKVTDEDLQSPGQVGNLRYSRMPPAFAAMVVVFLFAALSVSRAAEPLPRAHAHNDYLHPRPLLDALDQGFCSVEADIHLVDGQLIVAHDLPKDEDSLKKAIARTLRALYLDPLAKRVRDNGGSVFADNTGSEGPVTTSPFMLLIDFKSEADTTYAALRKELLPFTGILTKFSDKATQTNAITIVLSGNRPTKAVAAERERFVAIDGRLPDLDTNPPPALVPLISDNWTKFFQWRGVGRLSTDENIKLRQFVTKAHEQGRRIRFWAVPDTRAAWEELYSARVDLINTDDLPGLANFLRTR